MTLKVKCPCGAEMNLRQVSIDIIGDTFPKPVFESRIACTKCYGIIHGHTAEISSNPGQMFFIVDGFEKAGVARSIAEWEGAVDVSERKKDGFRRD